MCVAIVVAGGTGERFGDADGKQLALVDGLPVVARTLLALDAATSVESVVLVCHPDRVAEFRARAVDDAGVRKVTAVIAGGSTRQDSVACGLAAVGDDTEIVAIHDGARPLVEPAVVDDAVAALERRADLAGVVVGHPAFDTMKTVTAALEVVATPDRGSLWVAQTPQVFRTRVLKEAHTVAEADGFVGTDDASLVERVGGKVAMIEGPRWNVKVTVPEDLVVAAALLRSRPEEGESDD